MRIIKTLSLFIFIVYLQTVNGAAEKTAKSLKIEDFIKLPYARDVQISPDGKHYSIIFRKDGEDALAILERETLKPVNAFNVKGSRNWVGKVYWVNNERVVYTVTENRAWNKQRFSNGELIGVNVDGSQGN